MGENPKSGRWVKHSGHPLKYYRTIDYTFTSSQYTLGLQVNRARMGKNSSVQKNGINLKLTYIMKLKVT